MKQFSVHCLHVVLVFVLIPSLILPAKATDKVTFSFEENTGKDYSIGRIREHQGSNYRFSGGDPLCTQYFSVVSETGEILTKVNIDREVIIQDAESAVISCSVTYTSGVQNLAVQVNFKVLDQNDFVPYISGLTRPVAEREVYENVQIGQIVVYLMPFDLDSGLNGTVNVSISDGNNEGFFGMSLPSGQNDTSDRLIILKRRLNYNTHPMYNLTLSLTDGGTPPLTSTQYLVIIVNDVNDQAPVFTEERFTLNISEAHPIGSLNPIGTVGATDSDSPTHSQIFYQLDVVNSRDPSIVNFLAVNTTSGSLYLTERLDYDGMGSQHSFQFIIEARNPGSPSGTKAYVTLNILDANDEAPQLKLLGSSVIWENSDSSVFKFSFQDNDQAARDRDIGRVIVNMIPPRSYQLSTLPNFGLIIIKINESTDREVTPFILMNVTVFDNATAPLSTTQIFNVTVLDVNDNAPQFLYRYFKSGVSSSSKPLLPVGTVAAFDPDEGENGTIIYSLTGFYPPIASNWFIINNETGEITLVNEPSEEVLTVILNVTCIDEGIPSFSNSTTFTVHISPPVTFGSISFQQYNNIDFLSSTHLYIEFLTHSSDALLLYQSSTVEESLTIVNNTVVYNGRIESGLKVGRDEWYSLLLNKTEGTLSVWERGTKSPSTAQANQILSMAGVRECQSQSSGSTLSPLYIGGVPNAFDLSTTPIIGSDFIGSIAAIVIDNQHLNLSCPRASRNTIVGTHYSSVCEDSNVCSDWSVCVPFIQTGSSPCHCNSGLPYETCDSDEDFGPITISNQSYIQLYLGYDFFYSKAMSLTSDHTMTDSQTILLSFMHNMRTLAGVLLYSETSNGIVQRLEVNKTLRYTVTQNQMPKLSLVSEEYNFRIGKEYELELTLSRRSDYMKMNVREKESESTGRYLHITAKNFSATSVFYPFATQPHTHISLGGLSVASYQGHFSGCITGFMIDGMMIPLRGLMTTRSQNYTSKDGALPYCHLCNNASTCPTHSLCNELSPTTHECICDEGYLMINESCVLPSSSILSTAVVSSTIVSTTRGPVTGGVDSPTDASELKLYYIIIIAGTVVIILAFLIVLMAVMFRCAYTRGKKETQRPQIVTQITYHQDNGRCCNEESSKENGDINNMDNVVPVINRRGNDYVKTSILKNPRSLTDEIDSAIEISSPYSCRKSTSQETGFHTASEPDGPSTRSSPRRDSVSKDSERYSSDFTSIETDSEELTTSGIDDAMSPHEVRLVSSGSMMGVPSFRFQNHLTTAEKTLLNPLKSNGALLLSEDDTDTEVSTSSPQRRGEGSRYYLNNDEGVEGRSYYLDNDSLASNQNSPKWYKTSSPSTVVESESESAIMNHNAISGSLTRLSSFPKGGRGKHKGRPPNLPPHIRHHKGSSPHHSPFMVPPGHAYNSSPLIKSHRLAFDYPSMATSAITPAPPPPPHPHHGMYYDPVTESSRLPAIAESMQYPPYPPQAHSYHPRQHDHAHHIPDLYYPGYQGVGPLSGGGGIGPTTYCDLNSFSKVNPITYWEGQQRLRPTVDQEDPLQFLREPCRKFEDVSTTPSVAESNFTESVVAERDSCVSENQGRGVVSRPTTSRGVHNDYVIMPRTLPPHPLTEEESQEEIEQNKVDSYHGNGKDQRGYHGIIEDKQGYHSNSEDHRSHSNDNVVDRRGYHSDDAGRNGYHDNMATNGYHGNSGTSCHDNNEGEEGEEITHFPSADCTPTLSTDDYPIPPVPHSAGFIDERHKMSNGYRFPQYYSPEV